MVTCHQTLHYKLQIYIPNFVNFYHTVNHMSMLNMFQQTGTIFRVKVIHSENGDHIVEQNWSSK